MQPACEKKGAVAYIKIELEYWGNCGNLHFPAFDFGFLSQLVSCKGGEK